MPLGPLPSQSSPFAALLAAIVARLTSVLQVDPSFIRPVASDNYKAVDLEALAVYVRVYGPKPTDGQGNYQPNMGAGRLARVVSRRFRCYIYTRSALDAFGSDQFAIEGTNPAADYTTYQTTGFASNGQIYAEELVLNALDNWCPVGKSSNGSLTNLCLNVIHWVDSADGPPEREPEKDDEVIRSHCDFEVEYVLAQNPVDSSP